MSKKFSEAGFPAPNQYDDWRSWAASFLVALDSLSGEEVHNFPLYRRDTEKAREGLPVGVDGDMIRVLDEDAQSRLYVFEKDSWKKVQEDAPEQEDVLKNLDYVVEWKSSTTDDPSWYRVYKSGWVEQGGRGTEGIVTLPKRMKTTVYSIVCSSHFKGAAADYTENIREVTETSFRLELDYGGTQAADYVFWEARGQGASNEGS